VSSVQSTDYWGCFPDLERLEFDAKKTSGSLGTFWLRILIRAKNYFSAQNHWVSKLCSSSEIVKMRKHNLLETGSVSIFRRREGDTYCVGSLRKS
jgi:hypothetical protein